MQRRFCWTHVATAGVRSMVVLVEVDQVYSQGVRVPITAICGPLLSNLAALHLHTPITFIKLFSKLYHTPLCIDETSPQFRPKPSSFKHSACNSFYSFGFQILFKLQLPLFSTHCTRPLLSAANFATATLTFPLDRAGYLL